MRARTFKQRLTSGLRVLGGERVPGSTDRYETWRVPGYAYLFFLGPSGALRCGASVSKASSIGCPQHNNGPLYRKLLELGDGQQLLGGIAERVARKDLQ